MICAYNEMYLPLAQRILGDMYDFAVNSMGFSMSAFQKMFLVSDACIQFENGNPTYVAGMNGCELARIVIRQCGLEGMDIEDAMYLDKSMEYWIGWSIAYYQWQTGISFADLDRCLPVDEIYKMYPTYHEMDISLFVEAVDERVAEYMRESRLRRLRKYAGLSQSQLAKNSGVALRQIQLFEQGQRDINKTQGETLEQLANTLGCQVTDLLQVEVK